MKLVDLQAEVLAILNRLGKASSREVMKELKPTKTRRRAYTTVSTTLDRLHQKKLVRRTRVKGRGGSRYIYYPTKSGSQREIVRGTLSRLVEAFGPDVVASIYEGTEKLPKRELTELKRRIRRKSQK